MQMRLTIEYTSATASQSRWIKVQTVSGQETGLQNAEIVRLLRDIWPSRLLRLQLAPPRYMQISHCIVLPDTYLSSSSSI